MKSGGLEQRFLTIGEKVFRDAAIEGSTVFAPGVNRVRIRRGVIMALSGAQDRLKSIARPAETTEEILEVATISANGDKHVAKLISEAMERVGRNGVVLTRDGKSINDEMDVIQGFRIYFAVFCEFQ